MLGPADQELFPCLETLTFPTQAAGGLTIRKVHVVGELEIGART